MDNTLLYRLKNILNEHVIYLYSTNMYYYINDVLTYNAIKNSGMSKNDTITSLQERVGLFSYNIIGKQISELDLINPDFYPISNMSNVYNNYYHDDILNLNFYHFTNYTSKSIISPLFIYENNVCEIGEFFFDKKKNEFKLSNYNIFKLPVELLKINIGLFYRDCSYIPSEFKILLDLDYFSQYKYIPKHLTENKNVILKITKEYSRYHKIKKIF